MRRTCGLMTPGVIFGAGLAAAGPPVGKGKMIDEKSDKVVSEVKLSVPRPLLHDPDGQGQSGTC